VNARIGAIVIVPSKSLYYSGKVGRSLMIGFGHSQGGSSAAALVSLAGMLVIPIGQGSATQVRTPVFRVSTELVQTDVMVFDKEGRFVNGLRRDDFELRIDGKVKPVEFFERVAAGTAYEASQLTAARGVLSSGGNGPVPRRAPDRGRTIFFYVDDLHLDLGSLNATKKLVSDFIEKEMSQDDEVALASASGQIGFLQQLTDDKTVLRHALQRIALRPNSIRDLDRPPMSEYQALLIDKYDRDVTTVFVQETVRNNPGLSFAQAESLVRGRARVLLEQAGQITATALSGLESLIRGSNKLPGRKLVFFLSGGFVLGDSERSNMRRITSAAARTGTVIYALDARGLVASLLDPSTAAASDTLGRLARASLGELAATQDGLNALARDTGGRPVFNTNALGAGLSRALEETSVYYLLAWAPEQDTQKPGTFRSIDVKLIGKPDLTVRLRRGFFDVDPTPVAAKAKDERPVDVTPEAQLREAIADAHPERAIPISLNVNYLLGPDRKMMLATALHIPHEFLSFSGEEGKHTAAVRISGIVVNDRGQAGADYSEVINVSRKTADPPKGSEETVSATRQILLGPGLYQVRVAARDERSGRIGSAHAWIEIPDLSSRRLTLSSLIVGARRLPGVNNPSGDGSPALADVRVDRRFQPDSELRFFVFTYNAARAVSNSQPDLAIQLQLLQENRTVIRTALKKMATENADLDRLPYAADLSLADLPPGRYVLKVNVVDRVSKTSASQQARFEIE
jgi:VWFA-related protein